MKHRSFIVRVWKDVQGRLRGQISDPFSEQRQTFQSAAELWAHIERLFAEVLPYEDPHNPKENEDDQKAK